MIADSVCPWSAADHLVRSAVNFSHPRQQGNIRADTPAASGLFCTVNNNDLGAGVDADNVVASTSADDAVDRGDTVVAV